MEYISIQSGIAFTVFAFFMFYQNLHLRTLAVEKNALYYTLWASTLIGGGIGLYWVYYYATHVIWYAPFMIIIAAIVVILFSSYLEKIIPPAIISFIGFVAWPIAAFMMFQHFPPAPFLPVNPEDVEESRRLLRLWLA